jgi:hypothetical protein
MTIQKILSILNEGRVAASQEEDVAEGSGCGVDWDALVDEAGGSWDHVFEYVDQFLSEISHEELASILESDVTATKCVKDVLKKWGVKKGDPNPQPSRKSKGGWKYDTAGEAAAAVCAWIGSRGALHASAGGASTLSEANNFTPVQRGEKRGQGTAKKNSWPNKPLPTDWRQPKPHRDPVPGPCPGVGGGSVSGKKAAVSGGGGTKAEPSKKKSRVGGAETPKAISAARAKKMAQAANAAKAEKKPEKKAEKKPEKKATAAPSKKITKTRAAKPPKAKPPKAKPPKAAKPKPPKAAKPKPPKAPAPKAQAPAPKAKPKKTAKPHLAPPEKRLVRRKSFEF